MITDSYHSEKESLFSPGAFLGERKYICDTAIATFSGEIFNSVLEKYPHKEVASVGSANGSKPVFLLDVGGKNAVFYLSGIGGCLAGNDIIEINWQTGIKNLIIFGSAGSLDSKATDGRYVIPTQAYRDEGMSYHYAPPSDYIDVKNSGRLADIFDRLKLPYVQGRIWTTDAPYRETQTAFSKRKEDGCIAVEMEVAGVQAVCDFYGIELYSFLMTGDVLDSEEYLPDGLEYANHSLDKFFTALKIWDCIGSGK